VKPRDIKDGPWFWGNKAAMRCIRKNVEEYGSAQLVFAILCDIASDHQVETFTCAQAYIGERCGIGRSTIGRRLKELESLGLVQITVSKDGNGLKMKSTFTLLKYEEEKRPVPPVPSKPPAV